MLRFVRNLSRLIVLCGALWGAVSPTGASAQGAGVPDKEARTEPDWVLPYFLTGLCIGLGLLVLCRPSRRENPNFVQDDGPS